MPRTCKSHDTPSWCITLAVHCLLPARPVGVRLCFCKRPRIGISIHNGFGNEIIEICTENVVSHFFTSSSFPSLEPPNVLRWLCNTCRLARWLGQLDKSGDFLFLLGSTFRWWLSWEWRNCRWQ